VPYGIRVGPEFAVDGGRDGVVGPRVPDRAGGADELAGALVSQCVIKEAAAPEVLAGPGVVGGDGVPPRPAPGKEVEACQATGQVAGFVVRGVLRGDQADVLGDACERGQLRDRIRATGDVQIQDLAVLLA
jgi:hypothetical protein